MHRDEVQELLEQVRAGRLQVAEAVERLLQAIPGRLNEEIFPDHHRLTRQGFPEFVFAEGKSPEQVAVAMSALVGRQSAALATRVSPEVAAFVRERLPAAAYDPRSRVLRVGELRLQPVVPSIQVGVITAGTSDIPVAEEAAQVAEFLGHQVSRVYDIGVAGIHRLLEHLPDLERMDALIVVAGMEGALPSVVGGLVGIPIVAVPTSVGYGTHFDGVAPLLTMLNSCAAGIVVVNIDNGFGAALAVHRMAVSSGRRRGGKQ